MSEKIKIFRLYIQIIGGKDWTLLVCINQSLFYKVPDFIGRRMRNRVAKTLGTVPVQFSVQCLLLPHYKQNSQPTCKTCRTA